MPDEVKSGPSAGREREHNGYSEPPMFGQYPPGIPPYYAASLLAGYPMMPPPGFPAPPPGAHYNENPFGGDPAAAMAMATVQAMNAMMAFMGGRAHVWQHVLASLSQVTAAAARASQTAWDTTPQYADPLGMQGPKVFEALRNLPPDMAAQVWSHLSRVQSAEAARRAAMGATAASGPGPVEKEIDLEELREKLPEDVREQVIWAVKLSQRMKREWGGWPGQTPANGAGGGYDW